MLFVFIIVRSLFLLCDLFLLLSPILALALSLALSLVLSLALFLAHHAQVEAITLLCLWQLGDQLSLCGPHGLEHPVVPRSHAATLLKFS